MEPVTDEMARRELPSYLGTPHTIEALENTFGVGGVSEHPEGGKLVTVHEREYIDYVTRKLLAIKVCQMRLKVVAPSAYPLLFVGRTQKHTHRIHTGTRYCK